MCLDLKNITFQPITVKFCISLHFNSTDLSGSDELKSLIFPSQYQKASPSRNKCQKYFSCLAN